MAPTRQRISAAATPNSSRSISTTRSSSCSRRSLRFGRRSSRSNPTARTRLLHPLAGAEEAVLADGGWMIRRAAWVLVGVIVKHVPGVPTMRARKARAIARLEGIAEQYLDALVAKDPKKLPVASNVKYTENGQRLQLGDGFWNSVTGRGTLQAARRRSDRRADRHVFDDARGGQSDDHRGAVEDRWQPASHRDRDARRAQRERREVRGALASRARRSRVRRRRPIACRERSWCASPTCISAACS